MKRASLTVLVALGLGCATTQDAMLSKANAERIALTRVPGGLVKESELEKEQGRIVWSVDVATPRTSDITEVQVDAATGEIVSVEKETVAAQQAEKKQDEKRQDGNKQNEKKK